MESEERTRARKPGLGLGLMKGLAVTLKHLFKHNTVIQYPDVTQELPARTRGVIALKEENCTVCMLCARECPDWCIYIDSHKETLPSKREGGRARKRNQLDRFAIDYSLCMYCGICVEVCPYDALFWSPEFEFSEFDITELTHEKEKLSDWMATVPPPTELAAGAELPGERKAAERAKEPRAAAPSPVGAEIQPAATGAPPAGPPRGPAEAPAATAAEASEDPDAAFERVLREETAKGSSERVATARAKAARIRILKGTSGPKEPSVPVPAQAPSTPATPSEDPDAAFERVLREETAKGSSERVATARAKVARMRILKGTSGPKTPPTEAEPSAPRPAPPDSATRDSTDQAPAGVTAPRGDRAPASQVARSETGYPAPPDLEGLVANIRIPSARREQASLQVTEEPEAVYRQVLDSQLAAGASPAVAEARARVARQKAVSGIPRGVGPGAQVEPGTESPPDGDEET